MKKLKVSDDREGFPKIALREISLLRHLDHPNIVKLIAVHPSRPCVADPNVRRIAPLDPEAVPKMPGPMPYPSLQLSSIWMIMEYCPHDLSGLIEIKRQSRGTGKGSEFVSRC